MKHLEDVVVGLSSYVHSLCYKAFNLFFTNTFCYFVEFFYAEGRGNDRWDVFFYENPHENTFIFGAGFFTITYAKTETEFGWF